MTGSWVRGGLAVAALLVGGAAAPLPGQQAVRDTVDRIRAIVGNTVILESQVQEELYSRVPENQLPQDPQQLATLRANILQELIDVELLYQQAATDTLVKVTEEQVNSAVDEQVRNVRGRFPSDSAWRADLRRSGFQTPEEYRRWLTERQRKQLMTSTLIELMRAMEKIKPVVPTEREMRAFFESRRTGQDRPETISLRQIIITPRPSDSARSRAWYLADSLLAKLRAGEDFAELARQYSDDPGSAQQGGSVGWFRRGVMHPAFENAAFVLRPGFVSDPVETPFGYHLIQVERVQPAEVLARHILIRPELTAADAAEARALAERLRGLVDAGATFDSLQRLYHDPVEEREIRDYPVAELLPAYSGPLRDATPGLVPVFPLPTPNQDSLSTKYVVLEVLDRRAAGEVRFEDVKDTIRQSLGEQMALRRYIDTLRRATYVEVRGP